MRSIEHWSGTGRLEVAESAGGVLATLHPLDNVVRGEVNPWPPPELIQKFYASDRWRGRSVADEERARESLGYYCDLQSLNSEDAITWSFFGPLVYATGEHRSTVAQAILKKIGLPTPGGPTTFWLWRRVPHPEKPGSTGGPEIDFGIQLADTAVLGEAKWNSGLGRAQGISKNRSQLDLRMAYCREMAPKAMPHVTTWVIFGVARTAELLPSVAGTPAAGSLRIVNTTWGDLAEVYPDPLRSELQAYLSWKERHGTRPPSVPGRAKTAV